MACDDSVLIGVDGGATEVKAHAVDRVMSDSKHAYVLRSESSSRCYPRVSGFQPVPTQEQLQQHAEERIEVTEPERAQARAWVTSTAEVIGEVVRSTNASAALVGIGMPGLKSTEGRGINVLNNGPRIPGFLDELTSVLKEQGVQLAGPLPPLQSDADCCGLGEEHAADGLFRDVDNAYYVGCGTGVADALKLRGQLVPFDRASGWIQKAWQMHSALGPTFEQLISARGLNDVFSQYASDADQRYPEEAAVSGGALATTCLDMAALVLAELIHERLVTIKSGRTTDKFRGPRYTSLDAAHPFVGTVLDRVVIGQRLGLIYADPRYDEVFAAKVDLHLATLLANSGDAELCRACLSETSAAGGRPTLRPGFVLGSRLRAAPALGAAIVAGRSGSNEIG